MKPREDGETQAEMSDEVADAVKTLGKVAEYWLADPGARDRIAVAASAAPISISGVRP